MAIQPARPLTAEQFIRRHARKATTGAVAQTLVDLTPDALRQAQSIAANNGVAAALCEVSAVSDAERDHVFDVTYIADSRRAITLRQTVREVTGAWQIVSVARARRHRRP